MNRSALRLVGGALLALLVAFASPATAATTQARSKAAIASPLSLSLAGDLSFGDIIAGPTAGTVVVDAYTDARILTGVTPAGGVVSAARLIGVATPGRLAYVRWPTAAITLTGSNGSTMLLDQLRTNSVLFVFGGLDPRIVPADGTLDIRFGGRLRVGANQREGSYAGSFAVTLDYQ